MDGQQNTQPTAPSGNKSKKTAGIIIIIILLILLGWYFTKGFGGKNGLKSETQNNRMMQSQGSQNQPMSLKELMAGGSQKCEVSYENQNSQSRGTVYMAGGKMKGEFTSTVEGKQQTMHMINDGKMSYVWADGAGQMAIKMPVQAAEENRASGNAPAPSQAINPNDKYNYKCSSWSGTENDFKAPSDVKFTDYSEMMKSLQTPSPTSGSADTKTLQCSACDSLSGEQKTQCKTALSCK